MGRMSEQHREEQEQAARVKAERLDARCPEYLNECYRTANGIDMADVAKVACGMALAEEDVPESTWPTGGPMTSDEDFTPAEEGF